jgi:trk system potassium uptake protein
MPPVRSALDFSGQRQRLRDHVASHRMNSNEFADRRWGRPWQGWVSLGLAIAAAASLIAGGGFRLPETMTVFFDRLDLVLACAYGVLWFSEMALASAPAAALRYRRAELVLLGMGLLVLLALVFLPTTLRHMLAEELGIPAGSLFFWAVRMFLIGCLMLQVLRGLESILSRGLRAEILLAASFIVIIAIGTLLLKLPNAMAPGVAPLTWVDAVFMSTSATSVTGLVVRDIGTDFSTFGQTILLALIQIGGLGVVTFVALLSSLSNKTLPVPQMVVFRQMINAPALGDLRRRVIGIVAITLVVEATGAALLLVFVDSGGSVIDRLQWAIFHSISAFCNSGMAFQTDSLESLATNYGAIYTFLALIVLGGLGFLVIPEILAVLSNRIRRLREPRALFSKTRFSVQAKLSIITTVFLIISGTAVFWMFENSNVLRGLGAFEAFTTSLFQSITARTAGFNTVNFAELQNATLLAVIFLMVIGGCPVSTSGGIKTVTFAILALALRALLRGNSRIEAFGRTIPFRVVISAMNVFQLYMVTAITGLILVSLMNPEIPMRDVVFECFSAISTVGLGTGITNDLSTGSKLVLCVMMWVGRVGPIAMVLSVFQSTGSVDYEFPEEDVVVG